MMLEYFVEPCRTAPHGTNPEKRRWRLKGIVHRWRQLLQFLLCKQKRFPGFSRSRKSRSWPRESMALDSNRLDQTCMPNSA